MLKRYLTQVTNELTRQAALTAIRAQESASTAPEADDAVDKE